MVAIGPVVQSRRRRLLEAILRWLDVLVDFVILAAGIFAIVAPPTSFTRQVHVDWLLFLWGGLLIIGGLLCGLGRLTRIWLIEWIGTAPALAGTAIYAYLFFGNLFMPPTAPIPGAHPIGPIITPTAAVAFGFIVVAFVSIVHRVIELRIFTDEPNQRSIVSWLLQVTRRRTPDYRG